MESYPAQIEAIKIELKSAENFEILFYDKQPIESYKLTQYWINLKQINMTILYMCHDGSVNIRINGTDYSLKEALIENKITMEEIIAKSKSR